MAKKKSSEPWYTDGLKFTCSGCGDCCTGAPGYVWVNKQEVSALAKLVEAGHGSFEDLFFKEYVAEAKAAYEVGRDPAQHEDLNIGEIETLARARYQALLVAGTVAPTTGAGVKALFTGNPAITAEIVNTLRAVDNRIDADTRDGATP